MKGNLIPLIFIVGIVVIIGGIAFFVLKPGTTNNTNNPNNPAASNQQNQNQSGPQPTPLPTLPHITTVKVTKTGFEPRNISVNVGEFVTFVNESGADATVNSDPHPTHEEHRFLNLGQFPDKSSVQARIEEKGRFNYHNHFHPEQKGTIVVE